jgi:hypothetical protein
LKVARKIKIRQLRTRLVLIITSSILTIAAGIFLGGYILDHMVGQRVMEQNRDHVERIFKLFEATSTLAMKNVEPVQKYFNESTLPEGFSFRVVPSGELAKEFGIKPPADITSEEMQAFQNKREEIALVSTPSGKLLRMAKPIINKAECMSCHRGNPGDLLGVMGAEVSLKNTTGTYRAVIWPVMVIWILLASIFFVGFFFLITRTLIDPVSVFSKSLIEVSKNISTFQRDQVSASTEQATALQETMATSEELVATAKVIDGNAKDVEGISEQTFAACDEGNVQVSESLRAMMDLKTRIEEIAKRMLDLGESSKKIGGVVDIIDEVSDQTNLLALNASIEAVAAGQAGLRFAVVAGEVRRLADSTMDATRHIRGLIRDIQQSTNLTITSIEEMTGTAEKTFTQVDRLAYFFNTILDFSKKEVLSAKEIKVSTQHQTTALEQMSTAISEVTDAVNEVVKGSEGIENLIGDIDEKINELNQVVGRISLTGKA